MKKQTKLSENGIKKGSYFVACWGYDQTQYSIYKVVKTAGNSTVYVEPQNSWGSLSDHQLAVGSIIKVYNYPSWDSLTNEEREDWQSRNFDRYSYGSCMSKEALSAANEVEITKKEKYKWTNIFTLSDGRKIKLTDHEYMIKQIRPLKKCLVNFKYSEPSIKINESITGRLDLQYGKNEEKYADQNSYTFHNGR